MSQHIQEIAKVLVNNGFTPTAAAGIIGNAYQESGWNPTAIEPGTHNGGLWGFTSQPVSLGDLQSYASAHGANWADPKIQAKFLVQHIDSSTKNTLNSIKSPTVAASYFMSNWEKPLVSSENEARRQQGAEIAFRQITGANLGSVGKQRAGAQPSGQPGTSVSTQTVNNPGVTTKTTSGGGIDYKAALANALLTPTPINVSGKLPSTSLFDRLQTNIGSGAYTTPVTNTVSRSPAESATLKTIARTRGGQQAITAAAVNSAQQAGAPSDVQHLLHMIHNVNGAAYNQANHDDINERDVNIKASGTDCSGFVSWLMGPHGLGIWKTSLATPSIDTAPGVVPGQGKQVTIWNNSNPGNSGHVFIQIGTGVHAQWWASEGGGVGIHQLPKSEVENYWQNGSDGGHYEALHPKGL